MAVIGQPTVIGQPAVIGQPTGTARATMRSAAGGLTSLARSQSARDLRHPEGDVQVLAR
jgi:hypothetical protein